MVFARGSAIRDPNDDVCEAGIRLIEPLAHHVESKRAPDAQFSTMIFFLN